MGRPPTIRSSWLVWPHSEKKSLWRSGLYNNWLYKLSEAVSGQAYTGKTHRKYSSLFFPRRRRLHRSRSLRSGKMSSREAGWIKIYHCALSSERSCLSLGICFSKNEIGTRHFFLFKFQLWELFGYDLHILCPFSGVFIYFWNYQFYLGDVGFKFIPTYFLGKLKPPRWFHFSFYAQWCDQDHLKTGTTRTDLI